MVTIRTIAEKCGLSVAAVSKALNGKSGISPERAEFVKQTARELGYLPNAAAQILKTNRSHNIGILYENRLAHEFFSVILEAIRDELEASGYDITLLGSQTWNNSSVYEHAKYRQCDGVIIVQGGTDPDCVQQLVDGDIPIVSIDHVYHGHTTIASDNVGSMEKVAGYLHQMGHSRIAFIHGEDDDVTRQRLAGFYRGCRDCGIEVPDEYIIPARYQEPKDSGQAVQKLMALKKPPTCILFPDDVCYLGGQTALEQMGLSVPEDVSCFGFDGIRLASVLRPRLTTYHQNAQGIGKRAAEELISAVEQPKFYAPQVITVAGEIQTGGTVKDLTSGPH